MGKEDKTQGNSPIRNKSLIKCDFLTVTKNGVIRLKPYQAKKRKSKSV